MKENHSTNPPWMNVIPMALAVLALYGAPALVFGQDDVAERKLDQNGIPEGYILVEGDMLVPAADGGVAALIAANLWPDASPTVIPFRFKANPAGCNVGGCAPVGGVCPAGCVPCDSVSAANQTAVQNAMAVWQGCADVLFRLRAGEADFIEIRDSSNDCAPGSSSQVGRDGGKQSLQINFASFSQRTIVHELGHALGFIHEQSRPDRGSACDADGDGVFNEACITMNCQNLCTGVCDGNLNIRAEGAEYGPYDFGSIMHYNGCANNRSCCDSNCPIAQCCLDLDADAVCDGDGGCRPPTSAACIVIAVQAPNAARWQSALGRPDLAVPPGEFAACDPALVNGVLPPGATPNLSCLDALTMSFLYPKANWRFVDDDDECACPFGIGGCSDNGSFKCPFGSLAEAVDNTPCGGTLWVEPGSYTAECTFSKSMTIRAGAGSLNPSAGVTLGK